MTKIKEKLGKSQMNGLDFYPHFSAGDGIHDTLFLALEKLGVFCQIPHQDFIEVVGSQEATGFVDQVVDIYIGLLGESLDRYDKDLIRRLTPDQIRVSLHQLIRYRQKDPVNFTEPEETPPPSLWEYLWSFFWN